MGRGRKSLSFKLDLDFAPGAVSLVWNRGFELHLKQEVAAEKKKTTGLKAAIDLGEIHHSAVSTNNGQGLIVSGRGIRSLKRQRNMANAKLSRKQSKCTKYSKRWKKLQAAKNRFCLKNERQIREYRHQAPRLREAIWFPPKILVLFRSLHGFTLRECHRIDEARYKCYLYGFISRAGNFGYSQRRLSGKDER